MSTHPIEEFFGPQSALEPATAPSRIDFNEEIEATLKAIFALVSLFRAKIKQTQHQQDILELSRMEGPPGIHHRIQIHQHPEDTAAPSKIIFTRYSQVRRNLVTKIRRLLGGAKDQKTTILINNRSRLASKQNGQDAPTEIGPPTLLKELQDFHESLLNAAYYHDLLD